MKIDDFMAFCKRRGLVYQNSEIYGGLAGFYDYGPIGVEIINNIKKEWWDSVVRKLDNVVGISGSIITHRKVWEASGHTKEFIDFITECKKCKTKFRADHLIEEQLKIKTEGMKKEELNKLIKKVKCPNCKGELKEVTEFNLMFETKVGPGEGEKTYLRPETAQLIFINFKNVLDTTRLKLPFGIAQIGKVFRNEISPRNFLFRMREFEQMEVEFSVYPKNEKWQVFDEGKHVKDKI